LDWTRPGGGRTRRRKGGLKPKLNRTLPTHTIIV
jgi:hypothetical protein